MRLFCRDFRQDQNFGSKIKVLVKIEILVKNQSFDQHKNFQSIEIVVQILLQILLKNPKFGFQILLKNPNFAQKSKVLIKIRPKSLK